MKHPLHRRLPLSELCRNGRRLLLLVLLAIPWIAAYGQAFVVTGGSSSTSNAHGGAVEFRTDKRAGRVDIGVFGKPSLGFSVLQNYRGQLVTVGDQQLSLTTPTDTSGAQYYFLARGVSVQHKGRASQSLLFAGATSTGLHAPFLNVSRAESWTIAYLGERQLSRSVRWFSRNVLAGRQTSIQSLEWSGEDTKVAVSAGVGGNQPYAASTLSVERRWVTLDAGYSRASENFRRVTASVPQFTENDRENIRVQLAPVDNVRVVVSRNNYLAPGISGAHGRATVNAFGVGTSLAGIQLHGSVFQSVSAGSHSHGQAFGVRRALTSRLEGSFDVFGSGRMFSGNGAYVASLREMLSPRLTINQVITEGQGHTSVSWGGTLISNIVSLTAEYQTVFLPFVTAGPTQFKQVLVLGMHVQLPHGMQLQADTNVDPTGKVRYTTYATSYGYRAMSASPGASSSGGFFRYMVSGHVVDVGGEAVEGAAVKIGGDLAFTNSEGAFSVRVKKDQALPFSVALDEFVTPGRYQVVTAPERVLPAFGGDEKLYNVIVRRLPNASDAPGATDGKNEPAPSTEPTSTARPQ